jgi:hypothetical protein
MGNTTVFFEKIGPVSFHDICTLEHVGITVQVMSFLHEQQLSSLNFNCNEG